MRVYVECRFNFPTTLLLDFLVQDTETGWYALTQALRPQHFIVHPEVKVSIPSPT